MVWLRFIANMDWKPKASVTLGYRVGDVANVTRDCATKALGEKKAVRMAKRSRHEAPVDADGGISQSEIISMPEPGELIYRSSWGRRQASRAIVTLGDLHDF